MTDIAKASRSGKGFRPINRTEINPPPRLRTPSAVEVTAVQAGSESILAGCDPASHPTTAEAHVVAHHKEVGAANGQARKALKGEDGKWQPTGDYEVGFGRPPVATRFTGKPGPGRPKGSVSYDKLMAKHLGQRSKVKINGREKALSHAELIVMTTIKDAIEGKRRDARKQVFAEMARLMAPESRDTAASPKDLNEADCLTLKEFYENVRAQLIDQMGLDPADLSDDAGDEA